MNAPEQLDTDNPLVTEMNQRLQAMREDYLREGWVTAEARIDRIDRCIKALVKYEDEIQQGPEPGLYLPAP